MKTLYKKLLYTASGALLCLFVAGTAYAQRSANGGGGGGGGSHPSGGGGGSSVSSSRPSGGGGNVTVSRPSVSSSNGSRPSGSVGMVQRGTSVQQQRTNTNVNRQGVAARGNYGYAPRTGIAIRGNYGYPQRTGVAASRVGASPGSGSVNAYRSSPRIGYGNGSYWGNHGYYHYNRGYYNTYYGVNLGFRCNVLPYGYYPFFWGDDQYYFSNGLFYTYDNEEYTVVEPPVGAEVTSLPDKAQSIVINGQQYYELNGVYYQAVTKDDGTVVYMVAGKDGVLNTDNVQNDDQPQGPQMGDIVTQLPPDCRKIKLNGQKLWVSPDGVYYQELVDANGLKNYKVVGLPTDESDQN
ncbi:DUF6515 family protein [Mucilaginibacter sp.]|uniref:DUF6515 family protein n=1 Tax=Mucilaginibacter sp. TaxID=1882438 RepID=UPI00284F4D11|nr:DUF6515 family protein [Mucilaginibacter sp.]MDR3697756.1 hypothetical protein [Mucilaginibacter sp.]